MIEVGKIVGSGPLGDVSMHVAQPPTIGIEGAGRGRNAPVVVVAGISRTPGRQGGWHMWIVDRVVSGIGQIGATAEVDIEIPIPHVGPCSGPAGVFPLRFGGQQEALSGLPG